MTPSPSTEDPTEHPVRAIPPHGGDVLEPSRCLPSDARAAMYGTSGEDELRDVVVTADGKVLLAGFENGRPGSGGSAVGSRGTVLKYGAALRPLATLDTLGTDAFESLAIDPDTQRIWLAARSDDALPEFPAQGGFDYLLGELGPTGFQPMSRGASSTPELARQLAVRDGMIAIAGHEERLAAGGATWIDPFLATFDTTGAPQWFTSRRSTDVERNTAVDISGSSIVVGGTTAEGAEPGAFVTAFSRDADSLWRYRLSTSGSDEVAAVRVLPDGDILWAGTTSALLGETAYGGKDVVVGRLDAATGASIWTTQLGTDADEHIADLALDDAGTIYVVGDVTEADSTDRDVFLLALDETGAVVSQQQWGSPGDDVPTAIALDTCGTAVIVGHTTGDLAGENHGGRDGFVLIAAR